MTATITPPLGTLLTAGSSLELGVSGASSLVAVTWAVGTASGQADVALERVVAPSSKTIAVPSGSSLLHVVAVVEAAADEVLFAAYAIGNRYSGGHDVLQSLVEAHVASHWPGSVLHRCATLTLPAAPLGLAVAQGTGGLLQFSILAGDRSEIGIDKFETSGRIQHTISTVGTADGATLAAKVADLVEELWASHDVPGLKTYSTQPPARVGEGVWVVDVRFRFYYDRR